MASAGSAATSPLRARLNLFVLVLLVLSGGIPREVEVSAWLETHTFSHSTGQGQTQELLHLPLSLQPLVGISSEKGPDRFFLPTIATGFYSPLGWDGAGWSEVDKKFLRECEIFLRLSGRMNDPGRAPPLGVSAVA